MDLIIEENSALVTASSGGLGEASARVLVREGVNVVVNGRDEEWLEAAVEEPNEEGEGRVVGVPGEPPTPQRPKGSSNEPSRNSAGSITS